MIKGDNATGNFTKVTQRIPVRIAIDPDQPLGAGWNPACRSSSASIRSVIVRGQVAQLRPAPMHGPKEGDDALLPNGEEHFPHRRSP